MARHGWQRLTEQIAGRALSKPTGRNCRDSRRKFWRFIAARQSEAAYQSFGARLWQNVENAMSCYGELFPNSLANFATETAIGFAASAVAWPPPDRRLSQRPVRFTCLKASRIVAFVEPDPLLCVHARAILSRGTRPLANVGAAFIRPERTVPTFVQSSRVQLGVML